MINFMNLVGFMDLTFQNRQACMYGGKSNLPSWDRPKGNCVIDNSHQTRFAFDDSTFSVVIVRQNVL